MKPRLPPLPVQSLQCYNLPWLPEAIKCKKSTDWLRSQAEQHHKSEKNQASEEEDRVTGQCGGIVLHHHTSSCVFERKRGM